MRGHVFSIAKFLCSIGFLVFLFVMIFISRVSAASSDFISLQAKLVNSDGTNVPDGTYDFRFSIYDAASGGTLLWQETHSISVVDGVVTANLGSNVSFPTDLFNNPDLYLQIEMDTDGNTSNGYEEDFGRMEITSVAYAFHARVADALSLGGISYSPDDFLKVRENNVWNPDQNLDYFSFLSNNLNPLMYLDAQNDRVGVGTDAPGARLHVEGGEIWEFSNGTNPRFVIGDTPNTGDYGWMQWDSANNYFRIDTSSSPGTGLKVADNTIVIGQLWPDPNALIIAGDNTTERMRLTDSGLLGLGTSTPEAMLDINGSYNQYSIKVKVSAEDDTGIAVDAPDLTSAGTQVGPRVSLAANASDGSNNYKRWFFLNVETTNNTGAGRLDFSTALNSYTKTPLMSLLSTGSLGIGTDTPTAKLDVQGVAKATSFVATNLGLPDKPAFTFEAFPDTGIYMPTGRRLGFSTSGNLRMLILETGEVGIGTGAPLALLHVGGTFRVDGTSLFLDDVSIENTVNYPLEVDYGDGSDGDLTVSSGSQEVNKYAYVTGNVSAGATSLTVNDGTVFSAGDLVLIIQMQSGSNPDNVGVYEFKRVTGVSGNTISLGAPLENSYTSGTFNTQNAEATQVVRVPEYRNVTVQDGGVITAPPWDGYIGGIVVFKVQGRLTFEGTGKIDVSARGYRGGSCNGCGNNAWGQQGEGITGLGGNSLNANANGGGGGYGPSGYGGEPGAGGGCYTAGGNGVSSYTSTGGDAVCSADKLIMGGGAGGGGDDDNKTPYPQYVDGAGAVLVAAYDIQNLNVDAKGEDGIASTSNIGGVTGGGAGGTVKIYFNTMTEGTIDVSGGKGAKDSDDTGGDGGDGLIVKTKQFDTNKLFFADVSAGHVGIRNGNPEYPLDVGGIVRAAGFVEYSDERLKKDIRTLKNSLERIRRLRPVIYRFKDPEFGEHEHIGFLAQDVAKEFPQLVYKDKKGNYSVSYTGLVAPAVQAIKELATQVDLLKEQVDKIVKLREDGVLEAKKIETTHVVAKTNRTEYLEVDQDVVFDQKLAGHIVIKRGKTKAVIKSDAISPSSIIVVTQEADDFTEYTPVIVKKYDGKAEILIQKPHRKDLMFSYLIINTNQKLDDNGRICPSPLPMPPVPVTPGVSSDKK